MEPYNNFNELAAHETEFEVICCDRGSDVSIIAPHGGRIEPNTTEIACLIAGDYYNLFCFNGLKKKNNRYLHITSHRFDHPQALALAQTSSTVITVHGCTIIDPVIYAGGLDTDLIYETCRQLSSVNLNSEYDAHRYAGVSPDNLCNRGTRRKGMQLEVSRVLRDSPAAHEKIASAVRLALMAKRNGRG